MPIRLDTLSLEQLQAMRGEWLIKGQALFGDLRDVAVHLGDRMKSYRWNESNCNWYSFACLPKDFDPITVEYFDKVTTYLPSRSCWQVNRSVLVTAGSYTVARLYQDEDPASRKVKEREAALFINGLWLDQLTPYFEQARQVISRKVTQTLESERQKLLAEMLNGILI